MAGPCPYWLMRRSTGLMRSLIFTVIVGHSGNKQFRFGLKSVDIKSPTHRRKLSSISFEFTTGARFIPPTKRTVRIHCYLISLTLIPSLRHSRGQRPGSGCTHGIVSMYSNVYTSLGAAAWG